MKLNNYRYFNLVFLPLIGLNLILIALFNLGVDPYGVLKKIASPHATSTPSDKAVTQPVTSNSNATTLQQRNKYRAERFKINLATLSITRIQPKTIILGTSTALRLSPDHPALTVQPAYNLALPGAKMHDIKSYFDDTLANNPNLKQVIIGLDFFAFGNSEDKNEVNFDKNEEVTLVRNNKYTVSLLELVTINFSLDTFKASVLKIIHDLPLQIIETTEASLIDHPLEKSKAKVLSAKATQDLVNSSKKIKANKIVKEVGKPSPKLPVNKVKVIPTVVYENNEKLTNFRRVIILYFTLKTFYKDYHLSQAELNNFQAIVETCKNRNITLKVFFPPVHAAQLEVIHRAGLWPAFEDWKRQVTEITPTWDFSEYNAITTEPIENSMKNFVDSVHYQDRIASLILNRLYNYKTESVPAYFGKVVSPNNIESQLKLIRMQHQNWLKNNPETVRFVQNIKKQIDQ